VESAFLSGEEPLVCRSVKCTFTVCLRGNPMLAKAARSGRVSELKILRCSLRSKLFEEWTKKTMRLFWLDSNTF